MASQDNQKAMDGLLRRSLARDSSGKGDCPDAQLLAAYYDQSLGPDEAAVYDLHFSQCSRCREQLAALSRAGAAQEAAVELDEPVLVGARKADHRPVALATPTVAPRPAQSTPESKSRAPRMWLDLRWLAPVAAVLVLGTFVFMRFASRGKGIGVNNSVNNEVAMSHSSSAPQEQPAPAATEARREPEATKKSAEPNPPAASSRPPSAAPAPAGVASNAPSAPKSNPQPQRKEEAPSPRSPAPSKNAGTNGPKSMPGTAGRGTAGRGVASPSYRANAAGVASARVHRESDTSAEPAPAAPAPELNASLSRIPVAADSAEAVAPPPPPPTANETKSQSVAGRNGVHGGAISSFGKMKTAQQHPKVVVATPDSDVLYRIAGGGYIEISEDAGATWNGQLLNPSADFTAASAPEPRICWLVGRDGIIFLTEDGKNWHQVPSPTSSDLAVVVAKSGTTATITTNDDRKWSTDDAGKTWHAEK